MSLFRKVDVTTLGGQRPTVGTFGQLIIGYEVRDIAVKWEYGVYETNYDMLPAVLTGDGLQNITEGVLTANSSSVGTSRLASRKVTRYRTGNGGFAWFTGSFNVGGGLASLGLESDNGDKICIRNNAGVVEFGYSKLGVDVTYVASNLWEGDINPSVINFSNLNIFKIEYGYLGTANPKLYSIIDGETVLLHEIKVSGTTNVVNFRFPQFRMVAYAENGATVGSGSWAAGTFSNVLESRGEDPSARPFYDGSTRSGIEGDPELPIVAYRNKSTYNGFTHNIQAKLLLGTISTNSEGMYAFHFYFNPTTTSGGTYTDINTTSSVMEVNRGVTSFTGGERQFSLKVSVPSQGTGVATKDLDFEKLGVFLSRGQEVVITKEELVGGGAGNPNDLNVYDFNWQELF